MNYVFHIIIVFQIYLILALAMNLLAGYTGLLSMAQAATYGIGAYVTGLILANYDINFILVLFGVILVNLIISIPVIYFSIRLRDLYFALATMAWQVIIFTILYNWISLTNGPFGISGISKPTIFGHQFFSLQDFVILSSIISILIVTFFIILNKTHLIRLFQAVRDDNLALMTLGKKPEHYKALSIMIASAVSGIAGALFATYYSYIDPTSFTLDESILIISIVLIGGLGSVAGSISGALFYVLLPEALKFIDIPDTIAANIRMIIYSLTLILIVLFRPNGFFGKFRFE